MNYANRPRRIRQLPLEDMRVGWQKVVNSHIPGYPHTIYVFEEANGHIHAVTNTNQGTGKLVEIIRRTQDADEPVPDALPAKGQPLDYSVNYEGTSKP